MDRCAKCLVFCFLPRSSVIIMALMVSETLPLNHSVRESLQTKHLGALERIYMINEIN